MDDDVGREERAIYAIVIVVLAPVVVAVLAQRADFDGGTTLCLIGVVLGAIGIVAGIARARLPRLPRARVHEPRERSDR